MGKTSILLRFTQGDFKTDTRNTVGVDLKVKMQTFRGQKLKLTIWDTGPSEEQRNSVHVIAARRQAREPKD